MSGARTGDVQYTVHTVGYAYRTNKAEPTLSWYAERSHAEPTLSWYAERSHAEPTLSWYAERSHAEHARTDRYNTDRTQREKRTDREKRPGNQIGKIDRANR